MSNVAPVLIDLVAIAILVYPLYFRRHRRRDVLLALVATNVGIVALAFMLAHTPLARTTGLGLGLIGVLRMIRLRSTVIAFEEIAYFLVAMALGLFCAVRPDPTWLTPVAAFGVLLVVFVVDHPRLDRGDRQQELLLDKAFPDEADMVAHLRTLLQADIRRATVRRLDMVRDTTLVDVRYRVPNGRAPGA